MWKVKVRKPPRDQDLLFPIFFVTFVVGFFCMMEFFADSQFYKYALYTCHILHCVQVAMFLKLYGTFMKLILYKYLINLCLWLVCAINVAILLFIFKASSSSLSKLFRKCSFSS